VRDEPAGLALRLADCAGRVFRFRRTTRAEIRSSDCPLGAGFAIYSQGACKTPGAAEVLGRIARLAVRIEHGMVATVETEPDRFQIRLYQWSPIEDNPGIAESWWTDDMIMD
jgi:hypothetical protein